MPLQPLGCLTSVKVRIPEPRGSVYPLYKPPKTRYTKPMNELLAILIPGAVVIGGALLVAKLGNIKLFTKEDGYTAGWVEGFIFGMTEDEDF